MPPKPCQVGEFMYLRLSDDPLYPHTSYRVDRQVVIFRILEGAKHPMLALVERTTWCEATWSDGQLRHSHAVRRSGRWQSNDVGQNQVLT